MPGIEMPHDFFPQPGDRFWTPADWAWAGGLLDCLLPSLHCGVPVVARRFDKFDPDEAYAVMGRHGVRNAFIPPTALRMMRSAPDPRGRYDLRLRTVGSGGEVLGARDFRMGQGGARRRHQRVLRPDRMQSGAVVLRDDRRVAAGCDRQAGAGSHRRRHPARRHAAPAGEIGQIAVKASRPGDVPRILGTSRRPRARSSSATG